MYRKSQEVSPTYEVCYWKKPKMADIGTNVKRVKIEEYAATIIKKKDQPKFNFNNDLVENFLIKLLEKTYGQNNIDSHIVKFFRPLVFQNM